MALCHTVVPERSAEKQKYEDIKSVRRLIEQFMIVSKFDNLDSVLR